MDYLVYGFLIFFWTGICLIVYRKKGSFRESVFGYYDRFKDSAVYRKGDKAVGKLRRRVRTASCEKELSQVLSYLKNIAILGHAGYISSAYLMDELSDFSAVLKPAFLRMARCLNDNDRASAEGVLGEFVGTKSAKEIGIFLAGWDDLNPSDILGNIDAYRTLLREERLTAEKRRDETVSDLIYFPVILNCMAVLLNFIYLAYYLQQREMIELLFGV